MPSKNKAKIAQYSKRLSFSSVAHTILNVVLPLVVLGMVNLGLNELALGLVLLSKWRIFAVQPRHWLANMRSNSIDLIVNLSTLAFMFDASTFTVQAAWTAWYVVWLLVIKPRSDTVSVAIQATAGLFLGLSAIFLYYELSEVVVLLAVWLIATSTARHFLSSYEEPYTRVYAYIWGLFVLQLAWVLYNWTLAYFVVPQLALIVGVIGYTLASLYDQSKKETISPKIIRQHLILATAILAVIVVMADWSGASLIS
jgi:hypothetical protein